jgi:hypothetical protein
MQMFKRLIGAREGEARAGKIRVKFKRGRYPSPQIRTNTTRVVDLVKDAETCTVCEKWRDVAQAR